MPTKKNKYLGKKVSVLLTTGQKLNGKVTEENSTHIVLEHTQILYGYKLSIIGTEITQTEIARTAIVYIAEVIREK